MRPTNNVLLVDDDPMSNMINEKIIQLSKFTLKVTSYSDSNKALEFLNQLRRISPVKFPNFLFIDINMPEMNGWEFIAELTKFPQSDLKDSKVFMLTSSIDQEDIEKSKSYKLVSGFISKPLTIERVDILFSHQDEPSRSSL